MGSNQPEERAAAGKSVSGHIRLRAAYSGANVLISISDDGRGLDAEAIRARAVEKGLVAPDARLTESEIHSLILAPGFSTAKQVTGLSGRGVGMDVVRRNVETLRGTLDISSRPGAGTTVTLRLPLTLAIIDGLLVRIAGAHFVAPLSNVLECIELTAAQVREANGKHLVNVRGELIPYIRLREYFGVPGAWPGDRADPHRRIRGGTLRLRRGRSIGRSPDGDQESRARVSQRASCLRRHHSGRRYGGFDPGRPAAGGKSHPDYECRWAKSRAQRQFRESNQFRPTCSVERKTGFMLRKANGKSRPDFLERRYRRSGIRRAY